jgi:hypothetical protein
VRELREFADDIRYAFRGLAARPGFTAIAVLTLGIGIGANTAIYSAVNALLLRSLPFAEPGRLFDIVQASADDGNAPWSYPKYTFFRDNQRSYATLAAHSSSQTILTGSDPERVGVEEVTAQYLSTLGVQVARGRDFPRDIDAGPGGRRVAVISDALWQRRFNGDLNVVGKSLSLNNQPWRSLVSCRLDFVDSPDGRGPAEPLRALGRGPQGAVVTRILHDRSAQRWGHGAQAVAEARLIGPRIYEAFPMEADL